HREEKIALIARSIDGTMELGTCCTLRATHIVAGSQRIGVELACKCEQVAKLDPLVTPHTGNGRQALNIALREIVNDRATETFFVVENVVRDGEPGGHLSSIVNILPGAASTLLLQRL